MVAKDKSEKTKDKAKKPDEADKKADKKDKKNGADKAEAKDAKADKKDKADAKDAKEAKPEAAPEAPKADAKKDDGNKADAKKDDGNKDGTADHSTALEPLELGVDKNGREVLPHPAAIDTAQDPKAKAPAPARAPQGDARSMRKANRFCLIYRHDQFLVRREGDVGTMGTWSVTEYPSPSAAAHAYAQECSELTGDGFSDLRG